MYTGLGHERASKNVVSSYYAFNIIKQTNFTHFLYAHKYMYTLTHTHTHTGNERRDRRVAASIQFQRGDAIIFKIGDKEMEGEIANLYVSPGCHLVRCYKNYKNILFDNIISFFFSHQYTLSQVYMHKSGET